ncbi:hypothetical protein NEFER03_0860 [Nematocida sp. LUAm3]|nr:hypothetical protein NEFER03_0860 [Nematocida sp. LUAm3]KAI5174878.1 hypothetical protein NEFER02_0978 [Nematocida sp. LUAm2]KAI5177524.1 hypothetical protein NEFER01_0774 [Nematocida sp. LUAm1]
MESTLQEVFGIFASEENKEIIQRERVVPMLRALGYTVDEEGIEDFLKPEIASLTILEVEEMLKIKCIPCITEDDVLQAFQAFDPKKTGKLNISTIKSILESQPNPLTCEEIDACMEILNPDPEGTVEYIKTAAVDQDN